MIRTKRAALLLSAAALLMTAVLSGVASSASAEPKVATKTPCGLGQTCPENPDTDPDPDPDLSTRTQVDDFKTDTTSCSVYANGTGMGMYCNTFGGGDAKTLREKYGDQKFQQCRYRELPPTVKEPYNPNPDKGRFMLMTCLENIDFDTYNGGPNRTLSLSIVFVPFGTDTSDHHNGITNFLWNQVDRNKPMPVPILVTRPNSTPLVGIPTFFTFRWMDPSSGTPMEETRNGGAYREVTAGDVVMRARATKVVINPQQQGIKSTTCLADSPYREGALPRNQPADACSIIFPRSSASARKYATKPIPANIKDAFYADGTVTWEVTFGEEGQPMRTLGNGFDMRMRQVLPVQEVQAPNQPPTVIY